MDVAVSCMHDIRDGNIVFGADPGDVAQDMGSFVRARRRLELRSWVQAAPSPQP